MPCLSNASLISRLRDRPTMNCLPATLRTRGREPPRELVETVDVLIVEWVDDPRLELCISGESLRSAALGYERLLSSDSRFSVA